MLRIQSRQPQSLGWRQVPTEVYAWHMAASKISADQCSNAVSARDNHCLQRRRSRRVGISGFHIHYATKRTNGIAKQSVPSSSKTRLRKSTSESDTSMEQSRQSTNACLGQVPNCLHRIPNLQPTFSLENQVTIPPLSHQLSNFLDRLSKFFGSSESIDSRDRVVPGLL